MAVAFRVCSPKSSALFTAAYEGYLLPFSVDEPTLVFMEHAFDIDPEVSLVARVGGEDVAAVLTGGAGHPAAKSHARRQPGCGEGRACQQPHDRPHGGSVLHQRPLQGRLPGRG